MNILQFLAEGPYAPVCAEARYINDQSGRNIKSANSRLVPVPNELTRPIYLSGIMCPDQRKVDVGPEPQQLTDHGFLFRVVRRRSAKKNK